MKLTQKMVMMEHLNSQVKMSDMIECQLACEASFTARYFERATAGSFTARCFERATAGT